jgi:hypothetical protein
METEPASQCDLPVLNVHRPNFQHLSDSHPTPRHKLQHDPISRLHGSENDLIHQILLDNFPLLGRPFSKHLPQHGRITEVMDAGVGRIEGVEKGLEAGIPVALGGWFSGSGKPGQEGYDFVGDYGFDLSVAEFWKRLAAANHFHSAMHRRNWRRTGCSDFRIH